MATFVFRDGSRLTPWMLYQINRLDAMLFALFGVHVIVTSGIRTYAEQEAIFRQRYVTAGNINGRKVYDTRVWNGVRWYRISSAGTVAVPGTSNHEIQGTNAAVDLRDTGSTAGIATAGSARANWLRANAGQFDMEPEGYNFGEAWHYKVRNINNAAPSPTPTPVPNTNQEDEEMIIIDVKIGAATHVCALAPGLFAHLVPADNPAVATDITGQDRRYSFDLSHLPQLLRYYGCDRDIWDVRNGAFVVLDPLTGEVGAGKTWSVERAIRGELRGIAKPQIDPAPLVKAINDAIAAGRDYDAAEIADALREKLRTDPLK
ncbi:lysin A [Microbacterium phage FuzzBuster]|uniref:Lysin A n=1 Tax=Microbacterium phage FuzzBuster TaxID=2590935 RepID=A0A516KV17_9CAUD|nr:lysin A [Microbacterium phage FuzzBuster]